MTEEMKEMKVKKEERNYIFTLIIKQRKEAEGEHHGCTDSCSLT